MVEPPDQGRLPIRELARRGNRSPLPNRHGEVERRRHPRYARCMVGQMTVNRDRLPVACVDVGDGGAQVVMPDEKKFAVGQRVRVDIDHAGRFYGDDFTVVQSRSLTNGMAVHLAL